MADGAMGKVQFELVSPEKLLLTRPVHMVVVPGAYGYFGVLVNHAPMIVTVRPGLIEVYGEDMATITDRIFVSGGFCEVTDTRCTVLAEEAVDLATLLRSDRAVLEKQAADLREDIDDAKGDAERHALENRLAAVLAKLDVLAAPPATAH